MSRILNDYNRLAEEVIFPIQVTSGLDRAFKNGQLRVHVLSDKSVEDIKKTQKRLRSVIGHSDKIAFFLSLSALITMAVFSFMDSFPVSIFDFFAISIASFAVGAVVFIFSNLASNLIASIFESSIVRNKYDRKVFNDFSKDYILSSESRENYPQHFSAMFLTPEICKENLESLSWRLRTMLSREGYEDVPILLNSLYELNNSGCSKEKFKEVEFKILEKLAAFDKKYCQELKDRETEEENNGDVIADYINDTLSVLTNDDIVSSERTL